MPEPHIESSAQYLQEQQRAVQEEAAMQSDTNDTEVVPVYIELPLFVERHEDHYSGDDITRQYLGEIGDADLLTAEDEKILARAIVQGRIASAQLAEGAANRDLLRIVANAAEARRRFMVANTRLVVSIAKRYPIPRGWDFLDIVQEGNIGLERAVEKFDGERNNKFSTYATWWIRQAIGRAMEQNGYLIGAKSKSAQMKAAIAAANREEPLTAEQALLYHLGTPVSIHKPVGGDNDAEFGDSLPSSEHVENTVMQQSVHADLMLLIERALEKDREALELIKMRLGFYSADYEPKSLREIGDMRGITAEAIRRHISRGIVIIRAYLSANGYEADDFML